MSEIDSNNNNINDGAENAGFRRQSPNNGGQDMALSQPAQNSPDTSFYRQQFPKQDPSTSQNHMDQLAADGKDPKEGFKNSSSEMMTDFEGKKGASEANAAYKHATAALMQEVQRNRGRVDVDTGRKLPPNASKAADMHVEVTENKERKTVEFKITNTAQSKGEITLSIAADQVKDSAKLQLAKNTIERTLNKSVIKPKMNLPFSAGRDQVQMNDCLVDILKGDIGDFQFQVSEMKNLSFYKASLVGMDFTGTNITNCCFDRCTIAGTFNGATWMDCRVLRSFISFHSTNGMVVDSSGSFNPLSYKGVWSETVKVCGTLGGACISGGEFAVNGLDLDNKSFEFEWDAIGGMALERDNVKNGLLRAELAKTKKATMDAYLDRVLESHELRTAPALFSWQHLKPYVDLACLKVPSKVFGWDPTFFGIKERIQAGCCGMGVDPDWRRDPKKLAEWQKVDPRIIEKKGLPMIFDDNTRIIWYPENVHLVTRISHWWRGVPSSTHFSRYKVFKKEGTNADTKWENMFKNGSVMDALANDGVLKHLTDIHSLRYNARAAQGKNPSVIGGTAQVIKPSSTAKQAKQNP